MKKTNFPDRTAGVGSVKETVEHTHNEAVRLPADFAAHSSGPNRRASRNLGFELTRMRKFDGGTTYYA